MTSKVQKQFRFSQHSEKEMVRRAIPRGVALSVLKKPDQIVAEHGGLKAYQSKVKVEGKRIFLVRLIVNEEKAVVVTVYRTSKINKYWRNPL